MCYFFHNLINGTTFISFYSVIFIFSRVLFIPIFIAKFAIWSHNNIITIPIKINNNKLINKSRSGSGWGCGWGCGGKDCWGCGWGGGGGTGFSFSLKYYILKNI